MSPITTEEDEQAFIDFLIEGLVGTSDPSRLVERLGYESMEELLVANQVSSLPELLYSEDADVGQVMITMVRLRREIEAIRRGYPRHTNCEPSWLCKLEPS